MEKAIPINTPLGIFKNHRDAIILKKIEWNSPQIIFYGNISSNSLFENTMNRDNYNFKLIFKGVISLFNAEYDTYEAISDGFPKSHKNKSIFEIIENSNYIKKLPVRTDWGSVNHYYLSTYDDVFNIIAKSYLFELL